VSKKRLPKAIRPTPDETGVAVVAERRQASARAADIAEPPARRSAAPGPQSAATVVEIVSTPQAASARLPDAAPAPMPESGDAALRRSQALKIVQRHAAFSLAGGIIPLPIVNVASVMALIVRMVKKLSDHYGVPFEHDRARAIVIGLVGGAMPTGLGVATASTLGSLVPGANLIGLAVSSISAGACTRGVGRIFVEHFESGATLGDFPAPEGR
jgi:uncharacterized protein (DUF697 family)